jgi:glycine/D-amino acid oxidase-like deaminating enzyme
VTLIERGELAAGASGRNHGLVLSPGDPMLAPLAAATLSLYREIAEGAPVPLHLDAEAIGVLVVAGEDGRERAVGAAEADAAAACGVSVDPLDADGVREAEPGVAPAFVEGWLLDDGRRLDPAALTVSLALLAQDAGADVRRHLTVRALLTDGDAVRGAVTDEGSLPADHVVVATGPWTSSLVRTVGVEVPTVGARGWLVHLGGSEGPTRIVERAGWRPLPEEEALPPSRAGDLAGGGRGPDVGAVVHRSVDGSVLAGGSRQVASEPQDPAVPTEIARGAVELFPRLAGSPVLGSWSGIRPMSPDGRPAIGSVRDGLTVASGHGSQGVILGGGTGLLVAAMVLGGEPPVDPRPFDPSRFG